MAGSDYFLEVFLLEAALLVDAFLEAAVARVFLALDLVADDFFFADDSL